MRASGSSKIAANEDSLPGRSVSSAASVNTEDGQAWATEYWPDGSLVNILGVVFADATAVAAVTNKILAGPFNGSTFAYTVRRTRSIGSYAAIVDADVSITDDAGTVPHAVHACFRKSRRRLADRGIAQYRRLAGRRRRTAR